MVKRPSTLWREPNCGKADHRAIRAVSEGTASAAEQKRALNWIVICAAGFNDEPFQPNAPDVVTYMLGRRSVGLAIVELLKTKVEIPENS